MSKKTNVYQAPTQAEIAACAHLIYEREGRPNGKATEHWLQAEAQLIAERKAAAGMPVGKAALANPETDRSTKPATPAAPGSPSWQTPSRQNLRRN
jgi:Protein of unknown function (DUF2934)